MRLARIMLPLACSAPILLGCSTPAVAPVATAKPMTVQPVLRVRDAAGSARDFYQLGRYYQGQNRFAQAADAYRKALEYHKDDIEARNALATTYSAQGKLDEAIAEFEAILKVKPELAHLHNNLGYAYYLQGNVGNAVAAFETAMALEPGNSRTYNNLGLAYRKMGDSEKSRLAFARAAALNNTGAGAVAATGAGGNVASAAPSIALKNEAPRIDLPPQSASLPLTVGNDGVALAAATPFTTLSAPISQMRQIPDSIAFSSTGSSMATRGPIEVAASPPVAASALAGNLFRLEIANGNGITGLAKKVGTRLAQQGLPMAHLTNLKPYRQPTSFIQYRSGFHEQALRLGQAMANSPVLISDDRLQRGVDVKLVLGKDAANPLALFGADPGAAKLVEKVVERNPAS